MNLDHLSIPQILDRINQAELPFSVFSQIHENEREVAQETILMKALYQNHSYRAELIHWLKTMPIENINYENKSVLGWNVLHTSALSNHYEETQILLQRKEDKNYDYCSDFKVSLLHSSILSNNLDMIKLVYQYDSDIYYVNQDQKMALDYIIEEQDMNVILYILNLYTGEDIKNWLAHYQSEKNKSFSTIGNFLNEHQALLESIAEKKYLEEKIHLYEAKNYKNHKI
jgi:ankyrin repeat protein